MAYVALNEHRIPYDIDGTEVGYRFNGFSELSVSNLLLQFPTWMTSAQKGHFNSETRQSTVFNQLSAHRVAMFFFFPEQVEVSGLTMYFHIFSDKQVNIETMIVQGSDDSTNGLDGTWESATFVKPSGSLADDYWRSQYVDISFSKPVRCLKIGMGTPSSASVSCAPAAVHIFGQKASGQTPDDIVFTDSAGTPLTKLVDFGDTPEGTTSYQEIRVKNTSATKNANNINLQLNHADFDFSYSQTGPWLSVIDISSLGPGSLSQVIYLRHHLEPPLIPLGPKAARIIAAVGSWT